MTFDRILYFGLFMVSSNIRKCLGIPFSLKHTHTTKCKTHWHHNHFPALLVNVLEALRSDGVVGGSFPAGEHCSSGKGGGLWLPAHSSHPQWVEMNRCPRSTMWGRLLQKRVSMGGLWLPGLSLWPPSRKNRRKRVFPTSFVSGKNRHSRSSL